MYKVTCWGWGRCRWPGSQSPDCSYENYHQLLLQIPGEETDAQKGSFLPVSHLRGGSSDLRAQVLTSLESGSL